MAWYDDFKKVNGVVMVRDGDNWLPQGEYIKEKYTFPKPKPKDKKKTKPLNPTS